MTVTTSRKFIGGALALVWIAFAAMGIEARASAQRPVRDDRPLIIRSTFGADLFHFYCSNCHGSDAKGRTWRSDRQPPPDLTTLAHRNKGIFPRDAVFDRIKYGDLTPSAHGTTDMPVWGPIFRSLEPSEGMLDVRLENLVQYLESIQEQ
jgi:mono/diheme cytochrome c family protein